MATPPPDGNGNPPGEGLVDADSFLAFTARLHELRDRVEEASVSDAQRGRWQRKLVLLTDAANRDLDAAVDQLRRFEADLDRQLD